jgi:hypothetical protein
MAMSRWQNPTYAMNDYQLNLEKSLEKKLIAAKSYIGSYVDTGFFLIIQIFT